MKQQVLEQKLERIGSAYRHWRFTSDEVSRKYKSPVPHDDMRAALDDQAAALKQLRATLEEEFPRARPHDPCNT